MLIDIFKLSSKKVAPLKLHRKSVRFSKHLLGTLFS